MFVVFSGTRCTLYTDTKQYVRQFNMSHPIASAYVSGNDEKTATVVINDVNGYFKVYNTFGGIIRTGKAR